MKSVSLPPAGEPLGLWFRGSVVADDSGRPLRVYHGTDAEFSRFDFSLVGNPETEGGPFFTDCREIAADYGTRIVEAHVAIRNPYRLTYFEWLNAEPSLTVAQLIERGHDGFIIDGFSSDGCDAAEASQSAHVGTVYVPFLSPDQIRILGPQLEE